MCQQREAGNGTVPADDRQTDRQTGRQDGWRGGLGVMRGMPTPMSGNLTGSLFLLFLHVHFFFIWSNPSLRCPSVSVNLRRCVSLSFSAHLSHRHILAVASLSLLFFDVHIFPSPSFTLSLSLHLSLSLLLSPSLSLSACVSLCHNVY